MKKLTQDEQKMLWGDGGPYSEAKIVMETRILDDSISREMMDVRGNINPTTFEIVKKHRNFFENDEVVQQLLNSARYSGDEYGYEISTGAMEYNIEDQSGAIELMQKHLEYTRDAIIRMHKFVIEHLDLENLDERTQQKEKSLNIETEFDLEDVKFGVDSATFERAVEICGTDGIKDVVCKDNGYVMAKVQGNVDDFYDVDICVDDFMDGDCNCFVAQKNILCKHITALAIFAVMNGGKLAQEDKQTFENVIHSNQLGTLSKKELSVTRKEITAALRYIKSYKGPSSTWNAYQRSLLEGTYRLSAIISKLPVSKQTSDLLVNLLTRLDKKLSSSGVDDSDGIVGGFVEELVEVLKEYIKLDVKCLKSIKKLQDKEMSFGWEDDLVQMLEK